MTPRHSTDRLQKRRPRKRGRAVTLKITVLRNILRSGIRTIEIKLNPQPRPFTDKETGQRIWNASGTVGGRICISDQYLLDLHKIPKPGNRLWVKESWARDGDADDDIHACPDYRIHTCYRADAVDPERQTWRPAVSLPRELSRLTLLIEKAEISDKTIKTSRQKNEKHSWIAKISFQLIQANIDTLGPVLNEERNLEDA